MTELFVSSELYLYVPSSTLGIGYPISSGMYQGPGIVLFRSTGVHIFLVIVRDRMKTTKTRERGDIRRRRTLVESLTDMGSEPEWERKLISVQKSPTIP